MGFLKERGWQNTWYLQGASCSARRTAAPGGNQWSCHFQAIRQTISDRVCLQVIELEVEDAKVEDEDVGRRLQDEGV